MEGRHGNSPFRSSWMRVINTHVFNWAEWRAVVSKRVSIRTVAAGSTSGHGHSGGDHWFQTILLINTSRFAHSILSFPVYRRSLFYGENSRSEASV